MDELNRKMLGFAGFKQTDKLWRWPVPYDGEWRITTPNLTDSLDACIKWLVPEAIKKFGKDRVYLAIMDAVKHYICLDEELAPALCGQLEKLIDRSEK